MADRSRLAAAGLATGLHLAILGLAAWGMARPADAGAGADPVVIDLALVVAAPAEPPPAPRKPAAVANRPAAVAVDPGPGKTVEPDKLVRAVRPPEPVLRRAVAASPAVAPAAEAVRAPIRIETPPPVASAANGRDLAAYALRLHRRISRHGPNRSAGRGRVVIGFLIDAGGALLDARLISGSGRAALDRAALDAVRAAAPFPPPPAGAAPDQLRFSMPFIFQ